MQLKLLVLPSWIIEILLISGGESAKGSVIWFWSLWDCLSATGGRHKLSYIVFVAIDQRHTVEVVTVIQSRTALFKLLSLLLQSLRVIYSFLCSSINTLTSGMN